MIQFDWYLSFKTWPHRLMARTPLFQGGNTGSIPVGAAIFQIIKKII